MLRKHWYLVACVVVGLPLMVELIQEAAFIATGKRPLLGILGL